MESLIVSFHAITPVFLMIAVGCLVKRAGWISSSEVKHFNKVVFHTFMPAMIFWSIYTSDFSSLLRLEYGLFVCAAVVGTFILAIPAVVLLEKDNAKRGAMIHAAYRSNYILLGTPVVAALTPDGSTGTAAVVASITIPLYTVLAVAMLEYFRSGKFRAGGMLKSLARNPLILASVLGIAVRAAGLELPLVVESCISRMNAAASPVAMLLLGAAFEWGALAGERRDITVAVLLRLVVFPAVMLPLAALLGFRDVEFITLIPLFASPTAVNTFSMGQEMGADLTIASGTIAISTALSCVTMFFWISLFKQLGMF